MNEIWLEIIEDYLSGHMSKKEQLLFEAELAASKERSSLFACYRAIEAEMSVEVKYKQEEAQLKSSLERLNAIYFASEPQQGAEGINCN